MPLEKWSDSIVVLHGSDDPQWSEDLASLEALAHPSHAVLDFSGVHYLNSTHIARLLRIRRNLLAKNHRLILCSVSSPVWGTFLVTGLDKIFEFTENVPTALATAQMKTPHR